MDPLGGVRSQVAQAKAVQRGVKGQLKMAKAAQAKAGKLDRKMVLHMLLYLLFGLLLGLGAFVDLFATRQGSVPKLVFLGTALLCIPVGMLHEAWLSRRAEGDRAPGMELLVTLITVMFTGLGIFLGHWFFPLINGNDDQQEFALFMALAAIAVFVPHLLVQAAEAAYAFEPRRYQLWYFPVNEREREPHWNNDRIVIANLHFRRSEDDHLHTTVNVRLPMDAGLGEMVHLFVKDYNENRFPGNPIEDLHAGDGSLGWIFSTRRFLLAKQRRLAVSKRVLDPALTVADNRIGRDADIYFHRVITAAADDE